MDPSKSRADGKATGAKREKSQKSAPGKAFDSWLDNQLKNLYEPLAQEPIPQEMIDIIRSGKSQEDKET